MFSAIFLFFQKRVRCIPQGPRRWAGAPRGPGPSMPGTGRVAGANRPSSDSGWHVPRDVKAEMAARQRLVAAAF